MGLRKLRPGQSESTVVASSSLEKPNRGKLTCKNIETFKLQKNSTLASFEFSFNFNFKSKIFIAVNVYLRFDLFLLIINFFFRRRIGSWSFVSKNLFGAMGFNQRKVDEEKCFAFAFFESYWQQHDYFRIYFFVSMSEIGRMSSFDKKFSELLNQELQKLFKNEINWNTLE